MLIDYEILETKHKFKGQASGRSLAKMGYIRGELRYN